jgi:Cu+-exporting ATPase
MAIDPICGMTVDPPKAAGRHDYHGTIYYFCAVSCLERFRADPERALSKKPLNLIAMPAPRKPLPMMQPAEQGELDPVCGMRVNPATAAGSHDYKGKTYYFCAIRCRDKFRDDPDYYVVPPAQRMSKPAPVAVPASGVVEYVHGSGGIGN